MKCQVCGGPWHPASGDFDPRWNRPTCGPCYRHWVEWMRGHTAQRRRGRDFYKEAETSIRAT